MDFVVVVVLVGTPRLLTQLPCPQQQLQQLRLLLQRTNNTCKHMPRA